MYWGHVTSKDLLTWNRATIEPVLKSDQDYDQAGVFTGCFVAQTENGEGSELILAYSSIKKLSFHWSTPPYPRNAAGIALATSRDAGKSWQKYLSNPILPGEPAGVKVGGFRDPYVAEWPELSGITGKPLSTLYAFVSGSIQDVGPTSFLYEIDPANLTTWKYLNPLVNIPMRFQPSEKWCGNFGMNFECTNFMTLYSEAKSWDVLLVCPEGDVELEHIKNHMRPSALPPRSPHQQLWMSGPLVMDTGSNVTLQYSFGGFFDHGSFYASNSFLDPSSGRRIVHGWIPEEDVPVDFARAMGWCGALAIPREIFLLSIPNVVKALRTPLPEISCMEIAPQADGQYTLYTLGIRPIKEVDRWQDNCFHSFRQEVGVRLPNAQSQHHIFTTQTSTWELTATIDLSAACTAAGFIIRHNRAKSTSCRITFLPDDESITVDRSSSTTRTDINTSPEKGPFTLFSTSQNSMTVQEKLRLRMFSDGDVLEVFANERFALATTVYSDGYGEADGGISAFAEGGQGSAVFEDIRVWDGLNAGENIVIEGE